MAVVESCAWPSQRCTRLRGCPFRYRPRRNRAATPWGTLESLQCPRVPWPRSHAYRRFSGSRAKASPCSCGRGCRALNAAPPRGHPAQHGRAGTAFFEALEGDVVRLEIHPIAGERQRFRGTTAATGSLQEFGSKRYYFDSTKNVDTSRPRSSKAALSASCWICRCFSVVETWAYPMSAIGSLSQNSLTSAIYGCWFVDAIYRHRNRRKQDNRRPEWRMSTKRRFLRRSACLPCVDREADGVDDLADNCRDR